MRSLLSNIKRRQLIKFLGAVAALAPFTGRLHAQEATTDAEGEYEVLVRMLQLLFPHADIDITVYPDMAQHVVDVAARDEKSRSMLGTGLRKLDSDAGGKWLQLSEQEQTAALEMINDTPAFEFVRVNALEYLYRDPRGWKVVGYEGSALQYGGYVNRGFNDIDWLPGF